MTKNPFEVVRQRAWDAIEATKMLKGSQALMDGWTDGRFSRVHAVRVHGFKVVRQGARAALERVKAVTVRWRVSKWSSRL